MHRVTALKGARTKKTSYVPRWSSTALFCYIWSPSHKLRWEQDLPFSTSWWLALREMRKRGVEKGVEKGHRCTLKNVGFIHHIYTEWNNGGSLGKKRVCEVIAKNIRDRKKYSTVACVQCNYFLPLIPQCSTNNSYNPIQSCFLIKGWLCLLADNNRDVEKHE